MAKARSILKRRKAVRSIWKITRTMQLVATAKYQRTLRRALATKPYTTKLRELVLEVLDRADDLRHPLIEAAEAQVVAPRAALVVLSSNRGLAGSYNVNLLRTVQKWLANAGETTTPVDIYCVGRKGAAFFNYRKIPMARRMDQFGDNTRYEDVEELADLLMKRFLAGEVTSVHVAYTNFLSASRQRPEVLRLLPLKGIREVVAHLDQQVREKESQSSAGALDMTHTGIEDAPLPEDAASHHHFARYDFLPSGEAILRELLPQAVKSALFQCFLDASASENVSRMVAMKSATDSAVKMSKALALEYNRARQSQITTELTEIMGGVESLRS